MTSVVLWNETEAKTALSKARRALQEGQRLWDEACTIIVNFEQHEGWRALGYRSMAACLAEQWEMSRQGARDVIDRVQASILLEEETGDRRDPGRSAARRLLGKAAPNRAVNDQEMTPVASESDQLTDLRDSPANPAEPVSRSHFSDGSTAHADTFDEGETLYACGHCNKMPATFAEMIRRGCIKVAREEREWGAA